jgi:hypothetical protein
MGISAENLIMTINGNEADLDNRVMANDVIELNEKIVHPYENNENKENKGNQENTTETKTNKTAEAFNINSSQQVNEAKPKQDAAYIFENMNNKEESGSDKLLVIVNDKPIVMSGKTSYSFVDVFDYIDFDTSKMQGIGIATIVNGKEAQYTQTLHAGDKIEVYWIKG